MRGYPSGPKTKQDFRNLLTMPEHRERALAELQAIYCLQDDTTTVDETPADAAPDAERVLRIIENPLPVWKQNGFKSRAEVLELIGEM